MTESVVAISGIICRPALKNALGVKRQLRYILPFDKRIIAAGSDHGGVIRTEDGRRDEKGETALVALRRKERTQVAVGSHAAGEGEAGHAALLGAADERIYGVANGFRGKRRADVVDGYLFAALAQVMHIIDHGGLEPGKRVREVFAHMHIGAEADVRFALLGVTVYLGTAGVRQAEYARDFIEGLPYRVVQRGADRLVRRKTGNIHDARMSPAGNEREQRGSSSGKAMKFAAICPWI